MKKDHLVYCEGSDTIRQMPQNYLIAYRSTVQFRDNTRWIVDPDIACSKSLAVKVFTLCLDYNSRYGTGQKLVDKSDLPILMEG